MEKSGFLLIISLGYFLHIYIYIYFDFIMANDIKMFHYSFLQREILWKVFYVHFLFYMHGNYMTKVMSICIFQSSISVFFVLTDICDTFMSFSIPICLHCKIKIGSTINPDIVLQRCSCTSWLSCVTVIF